MVEQQQLFVLGQGRQAVRVLFYISAVKRTFRWPDCSAARPNVHFLYYSYFTLTTLTALTKRCGTGVSAVRAA
jgi:hypothetical protein